MDHRIEIPTTLAILLSLPTILTYDTARWTGPRIMLEPETIFASRYYICEPPQKATSKPAQAAPRRYGAIDEGGFGVVYRAWDLQEQRYVAIKLLKDPDLREIRDERIIKEFLKQNRERFTQEVRLLSREFSDCPAVVKFLGDGVYRAPGEEGAGQPYYVMEFLPYSLRKIMDALKQPMHWRRARRIAAEIAQVLCLMHERGYLHRDVTPNNIMLERPDSRLERVKLIDFGIVKQTSTDQGKTSRDITHFGQEPPHTAAYYGIDMPALDERSEVYALGTVLYELLTARHPYGFANPKGLGPPPTIDEVLADRTTPAEIPPALKDAAIKAIQRRPGDRFASIVAKHRS